MSDTAADCRRAMALISHHAMGDQAGITAILDEAEAHGRGTQLLVALCNAYRAILPQLRTSPAIECLNECIDTMTEHDLDWVRASAVAIRAHADNDENRFGDAIDEVTQTHHSGGLLFQGVNDIYFHLLPELRSETGLGWLNTWTARLAAEEDQ